MIRTTPHPTVRAIALALLLAPALAAGAGAWRPASAQSVPCTFNEPRPRFPRIPVWAIPGAYRDSSLISPRRCIGSFQGPLPDSLEPRARTITVRFLRDRRAEARSDFGGYRLYRVTNEPDTTRMVLIRRFSRQPGDERTWNFSVVDSALNFRCGGNVVHDSIVTFVDPDSNGNYVKVCRRRLPQNDPFGACQSEGDSVILLVPPPGPHDGFRTWYAVTYEMRNLSADASFTDLFVPDRQGIIGPCTNPADSTTCPNLNNKCYNMTGTQLEPTGGPTANLQRVGVVPNPFRAREAWDQVGGNELHFVNLPRRAVIRIYTVAGDLVARIDHDDPVRDFARWDLKNQEGREVASGIYMFRIEADQFSAQDRFIVIR
jgi:hypothetical protein